VSTDFVESTTLDVGELYVSEIYVHAPCTVTGIAVFNGSVVAGSIKLGLFDVSGRLLAVTASTAAAGADAYQLVPFASHFIAKDGEAAAKTALSAAAGQLQVPPGTYYIGLIGSSASYKLQSHAIGAFGAGKITGLVYATALDTLALTIVPPTTFTTALGPVASLY